MLNLPGWTISETGSGRVEMTADEARLVVGGTPDAAYSNAQITDYAYNSFTFRHRPPVRLSVRAAYTVPGDSLGGTAGFGFWNHPFSPDTHRWPRLPQAVWFFFAAPPNNMALAKDVPGYGWKCATINARRWQFLALLPGAPLGFLLMRQRKLYNGLWPAAQRALGVSEYLLDSALLAQPHTYTLLWRRDGLSFAVDGAVVHESDFAPRGPLGFIAWMDNQYAIVTPQGRFGGGVVPLTQKQGLRLQALEIV